MNDYAITREILEDKNRLETIIKKPVIGIAFPNGSVNNKVIEIAKSLGIQYGRIAADNYASVKSAEYFANSADGPILLGDSTGFEMPEDYMRWLPTCHHNHNLLNFAEKFIALTKKQYLYMMYVWGHSFEFEKNNNWEIIEDFCAKIGNRDDIWYATNGEIVEYNHLFDNLQFFADNEYVFNPSAKSVWIRVNDRNIIEVKGGETLKLS